MTRRTLLFLLSLLVVAAPMTAKADTTVIINGARPNHHHRAYHRHPPRWGHWNRPTYRPAPAFVYAPVFAPPVRPVIYETTVIRAAPQVVVDSSLLADPASSSYTDDWGRTCREYQSTAVVAGRRKSVYGTACLQPDGAWRVVD